MLRHRLNLLLNHGGNEIGMEAIPIGQHADRFSPLLDTPAPNRATGAVQPLGAALPPALGGAARQARSAAERQHRTSRYATAAHGTSTGRAARSIGSVPVSCGQRQKLTSITPGARAEHLTQ